MHFEFAILLAVGVAAGAAAVAIRQPVLIAYIAVGILAGPAGFGLLEASESVEVLARLGVTVLLFIVGLKLDLGQVRQVGKVALATGLGQLAFTISIGFLILLALGQTWVPAFYIAVALTFSSTIIIVKLLSDKREIDSLHGRIAIGFLVVQDIAVVVAMMAMSALQGTKGQALGWVLSDLSARVALAALLMFALMRYLLPPVTRLLAKSTELLLLFGVAWGAGLAAAGEWAGFSHEAGAFLAGFSLANTPYREAMGAKLAPIRDFTLLFFFLSLGAELDFSTLGNQLLPAGILSLFVLVGNPLIVIAIMGYMGYRSRTGFLAGLTVAQISEFSIVFIAMGVSIGHISNEALGLTTIVGVVTITLSTYMILYSHRLYDLLSPPLKVFERHDPFRERALESESPPENRPQAIVFGVGRYGATLVRELAAAGVPTLGVDFDPETLETLCPRYPMRFGDAADPGFLQSLPLAHAQVAVAGLPDFDSNRTLIGALRDSGLGLKVFAVARDEGQAESLTQAGADLILNPYPDAACFGARTIAKSLVN